MLACLKRRRVFWSVFLSLVSASWADARDEEKSEYLGVLWGTRCEDALLAFEARGFLFDPVTVSRHSPDAPHIVEAPRSVPVCSPAEADAFLDGPRSYQAVRGSTGLIKVDLLCRDGKFVGVVNRVNIAATSEYLCIQRAAGEVKKRLIVGGRIIEVRDRKGGGVRYFEQDEGDDIVSYIVLWQREDAGIRKAQHTCALEKAKLYLE
jgi:hypothetical protein